MFLSIKMLLRNVNKNPSTHLINLIGLTLSMAIVLFLGAYCYSELRTDAHHQNGDRAFLITKVWEKQVSIYTPGVLKETLETQVPGIAAIVRLAETWDTPVFQVEDNPPLDSELIFADPDFFQLFSYNVVDGSLETALREPLGIVLTLSEAKRLFGSANVVGKTLKLNNEHILTVTAVIKPPENNTFLSFKAVTSMEVKRIVQSNEEEYTNWHWHNFKTFVLLDSQTSKENIESAATAILKEHANEDDISLLPVRDIYFARFNNSWDKSFIYGDKTKTLILLLVAFIVLFIAMINFINISSAHRLESLKQTGIQKIIGAGHFRILRDILIESVLMFLISFLIGIYGVVAMHAFIQSYTGISFASGFLINYRYIGLLLAGVILLGILASLVSALRIAASHPLDNLKKTVIFANHRSFLRSALVVSQFAAAIILIAFTLLVQKQVQFGATEFSFKNENILGIKLTNQLYQQKEVLAQKLAENPHVQQISFSQFFPGKPVSVWGVKLSHQDGEQDVEFNIFDADVEFLQMMGIELLQGRFYTSTSEDKNKVLVNEQFLKTHNIQNVLGSTFSQSNHEVCEIIGVIRDFHFKSIHAPISPLAVRNGGYASYCLVKTDASQFNVLHEFVTEVQNITASLSPAFPVDMSFMDEATENMYQSERQFRRLFSLFSGSAILISCFGILALSLFSCQRRIKEIGVRKVNGAQSSQILVLLNKDFLKWVIIAFIIACPIAWLVMKKWLHSYAYQTKVSWWIFALAGAMALAIAILTVSWQAIRAATANPVEALRYE